MGDRRRWDSHAVYSIPRGVPQGSPLSPLLANYFLDPFDKRLRKDGVKLVRYADDFVVLARTPFELPEVRETVRRALADLQLELNDEKTRLTSFDKMFRFLGAEIRLDSIMLPFKVKRSVKKPDFVAPRMSPALLRAYRTGSSENARRVGRTGGRVGRGRKGSSNPPKGSRSQETVGSAPLHTVPLWKTDGVRYRDSFSSNVGPAGCRLKGLVSCGKRCDR